MKVTIDIPEEFETDYASRFEDFWGRVVADIGEGVCGLYEIEIAIMFREAFKKGEYENLGEKD